MKDAVDAVMEDTTLPSMDNIQLFAVRIELPKNTDHKTVTMSYGMK